MYGTTNNGFICRYYKSAAYDKPPKVDKLREGIMELNIQNRSKTWIEVKNPVFSGVGMKIFFNNKAVSSRASMKVTGEKNAETDFINKPMKKGMVKSKELFMLKSLPIKSGKCLMEGVL